MKNFLKTVIGVNIIINISYILILSISDIIIQYNLSTKIHETKDGPCVPMLFGTALIMLFAFIQFSVNFLIGFWAYFVDDNQKGKKYLLSAFLVVLMTGLFLWLFLSILVGGVKA